VKSIVVERPERDVEGSSRSSRLRRVHVCGERAEKSVSDEESIPICSSMRPDT
jgi:hypothetical protein